jgi:formyltetrahydrofolate synthetase
MSTARPTLTGVPSLSRLGVRDFRAYTGARKVAASCGGKLAAPGLGGRPAATNVDIDGEGRTVGLL